MDGSDLNFYLLLQAAADIGGIGERFELCMPQKCVNFRIILTTPSLNSHLAKCISQ